jgi:hypothetical protein
VKGIYMEYKYDLNLRVFEFCIVISNSRRWCDIYEQEDLIKQWENRVSTRVYEVMSYGLDLMINGREPEVLEFFLDEFIDGILDEQTLDVKEKKDLRFVRSAIKWIHIGEGSRLEELLDGLNDAKLKSKYKYWIYFNKFDLELDFKTFETMSDEELNKLREGKEYIVEAYM